MPEEYGSFVDILTEIFNILSGNLGDFDRQFTIFTKNLQVLTKIFKQIF